jgi:hypothetical protein
VAQLDTRSKHTMVTVAAVFYELMMLDSVWTQAVEDASRSGDDADLALVDTIATQMDNLLARAGDAARTIRAVATANNDAFADAVNALGADERFYGESRANWLRFTERYDDARDLVDNVLGHIEAAVPEERNLLRQKAADLAAGRTTGGDVTAATLCAIGAGVAVVAAAGGGWPLAFLAAGYAGYECAQTGTTPSSIISDLLS